MTYADSFAAVAILGQAILIGLLLIALVAFVSWKFEKRGTR